LWRTRLRSFAAPERGAAPKRPPHRQHRIRQPRQRIVPCQHRSLAGAPHRTRPSTERQFARAYGRECTRNVRGQPHPPNPELGTHRLDRQALRHAPGQIREVDSRARSERMPRPHPSVDVQELVRAVARVALELDLHQSVPPQGLDDQPAQPFDLRGLHGLHERAGMSEVARVLPRSPGDQRRQHDAVSTQRGERVLTLATTGDQLLNDDAGRSNQPGRLGPPGHQRGTIIDTPRLRAREAILLRFGVGLQYHGEPTLQLGHLDQIAGIARPRVRRTDPLGHAVRKTLVVRVAERVPTRGGQREPLGEPFVRAGDRRRRLIIGREQGPAIEPAACGRREQGVHSRRRISGHPDGPRREARRSRQRVIAR